MKRNAERGVHQVTWPPEMVEEFRKTWHEVVEQKAAEDPFFKKVWDDLVQFRSDYKEWGDRAYVK